MRRTPSLPRFRPDRARPFVSLVARCGAALAAALLPAAVLAAPRCYEVDPGRSRVDFRIRLFGLFSPGGRFQRTTGTVTFDPEHWQTLTVAIRIPVEGLESRPRFWHDELLGPRFFDRARYPEITFSAARAEQTGLASGLVRGDLTLRGVTRPVALRARLAPADEALDIEADTTVRRSEFGLGGVLPLASDEVTIALFLHAAPGRCKGAPDAPAGTG